MIETRIFTSYFAKVKAVQNPVSISLYPPSWFKGPSFSELAPSSDILWPYKSGRINKEEYTRRFNDEILLKLEPDVVMSKIWQLFPEQLLVQAQVPIVTLLCFEKPTDFCHRHLVSKWLREAGYLVEEVVF